LPFLTLLKIILGIFYQNDQESKTQCMKFKKFTFIYFLFTILAAGTIFTSFSNNPPNGRTGAPGDGMCTDCHSPGNPLGLDGEFSLSGFPTEINPGETYSISVVVRNNNGLAQRNGFQAVVLDGANNNIGDLTTNGGNPATETDANGREYVEHRPAIDFASNEVNWTFNWTAPDDSAGEDVTLYIGSIVGNGGGSGQDLFIQDNFTAKIQEVSSTNNLEGIAKIDVFPNPTSEVFTLILDGPVNEKVSIRLMTATGQLAYAQTDLSLNSTTEISVAEAELKIIWKKIIILKDERPPSAKDF